jgi:hypothetical protein
MLIQFSPGDDRALGPLGELQPGLHKNPSRGGLAGLAPWRLSLSLPLNRRGYWQESAIQTLRYCAVAPLQAGLQSSSVLHPQVPPTLTTPPFGT